MTDTITFDMEPVRVLLRELAKEQAEKKDTPQWKNAGKRDPNPFTQYWFFAWYKRRAKALNGGFEPRLKGTNAETFDAYIAPFFKLGTGEKPTKEQWTELYHVLSVLFTHWRKFCDKHVTKDRPSYPPLGWLNGWWDTWREFVGKQDGARWQAPTPAAPTTAPAPAPATTPRAEGSVKVTAQDIERIQKAFRRGHVPMRLFRAKFNHPAAAPYRAALMNYLRAPRSALISGPPQSGKAMAVGLVMQALVYAYKASVLALEAEDARRADLLREREIYNSEASVWDRMNEVKVLAIFHVGTERKHQDFGTTLSLLLRARRDKNRITLITTTRSLSELDELYGSEVATLLASLAHIKTA